MTKYGKKFRKIQLPEWQGKYFDYKKFKQFIKANNPDNLFPIQNSEEGNNTLNTVEEKIKKFTEDLDKEIKRVYIFFTSKEKKLYKDINKYLHQKEDYPEFELNEYLTQFQSLLELSIYNFNLSIFTYYNLKAVLKILKKFDKKIIGAKNKNKHIFFNYIQVKLEEQNSDMLYLFRFKMIDEVNAIMESLIQYLKDCLINNKKKLKKEEALNEEEEGRNISDDFDYNASGSFINFGSGGGNNTGNAYNQVYNNVEIIFKKIKKNIKNIDLIAMSTIRIFRPWKQFLRISSDVSSRLMQMNQEILTPVNDLDDKYSRNMSIAFNFTFSKENKHNIIATLFHGFFYCFSFSVVIPTYTAYIDDFNAPKDFYGLLMMMAPLGALIGFMYETMFFKCSTKIPYILSTIEVILANIFYISAKKLNQISFLFLGRFLIGISNIRTHNKMYIINYLSKKDINFYLTMFHGASILGSFTGFFINVFFDRETFADYKINEVLNEKTVGTFINLAIAIGFLIFIILSYSEAKSESFNIVDINKVNKYNKEDKSLNISPNSSFTDPNMSLDIRKDSLMVENIDAELEIFNQKNKFDDTNLVTKSVNEIASQEKGNLNVLSKAYLVYIFIVFTTKFINESIVIYFGLNLIKDNQDLLDKNHWLHGLILSMSYLLVIVCELALSKKIECTRDKIFLIILLSMNLINSSFLIFFSQLNPTILIICSSLAIIISNLIQKTASHYFFDIIPNYYILCKIQGNILINIISTIGRIFSSALLVAYERNQDEEIVDEFFNAVYYLIMTLLSFFSLLFYCIYYSDIRVKAISRIIKGDNKNEIKIATDV